MSILYVRGKDGQIIEIPAVIGPKGETGIKGDPGYTPQRGIDYYTEADKQEMVTAVLAALPTAEGDSY